MKRNISDLLDFYTDEGLDLKTSAPLSTDRIRRLTMAKIRTKRRPLRRGVLFAAVVAALLAAAVSANVLVAPILRDYYGDSAGAKRTSF